jgi:hypothetical protein
MRCVVLAVVTALFTTNALAYSSLVCYPTSSGVDCIVSPSFPLFTDSEMAAHKECVTRYHDENNTFCPHPVFARDFQDGCIAVYTDPQQKPFFAFDTRAQAAIGQAIANCANSQHQGFSCKRVALACDGSGEPLPASQTATQNHNSPDVPRVASPSPQQPQKAATPPPSDNQPNPFDFLSDPRFYRALLVAKLLNSVQTGLGIGLGILIVILAYAKRAAIINFIIHGNLPHKLAAYADDVEVLFKRSQRVNWYGRVVFGITARLGLTEKQLALVRRYWLGRVIVFDSLRRQRQNQLARIHLQLAAQVKVEPPAKKPLSQLWATIKYFLFVLFYLFRALFSFLFGFLFIRVTIAKLARGKLIESTNLTLILQAQQAVEQSSQYLKEYLETAESFDGREELFEPK